MSREKKLEVITCPKCGRQYLPAEIYLPNEFFGRPSFIDRDSEGKILTFSGQSINTEEKFICDKCDTPFRISARITFTTVEDSAYNFDEDYTSSLKKESLFMSED